MKKNVVRTNRLAESNADTKLLFAIMNLEMESQLVSELCPDSKKKNGGERKKRKEEKKN